MFGRGCDKHVFEDVSAERFAALQSEAAANGIPLAGDQGSATSAIAGVGDLTLSWEYDRAAQVLTVQCTDKPMLLPCAMISARLHSLVSGSDA